MQGDSQGVEESIRVLQLKHEEMNTVMQALQQDATQLRHDEDK